MDSSRRSLLKAALSVGAAWSAGQAACSRFTDPELSKGSALMQPLDYGRSFICHSAPQNAVRFWVESRTRIIDSSEGTANDYYQCGSCKSENTFASRDLFMEDNYDFLPIFGAGHILIFRRHAYLSNRYRSVTRSTEILWGPPRLELRQAARFEDLSSWEQIERATDQALPIVAQTEIWNDETGLRAVLELPVKTMNISHVKKMYQVDSGPVAYPDLSRRRQPEIESFHLAFLAFNAPDFVDLIQEKPTTIEQNCQVYHYSDPFTLPARNRLLALTTA